MLAMASAVRMSAPALVPCVVRRGFATRARAWPSAGARAAMVLERPSVQRLGDSDDGGGDGGGDGRDDESPPRSPVAELPALRSPKAQAALAAAAAAAEEEEGELIKAWEALDAVVRQKRRELHDVESQLFYAEKACKAADEEQRRLERAATEAEALLASEQQETARSKLARLLPSRKARLEELSERCRTLRVTADRAKAVSGERREARALLTKPALQAALEAEKATAAADEAAAIAAAASERANARHSEAYAQQRVRREMADDAISVVASSAILMGAIGASAGAAFKAALGLEGQAGLSLKGSRSDGTTNNGTTISSAAQGAAQGAAQATAESAAASVGRDLDQISPAEAAAEAERVLACAPTAHRLVLGVSDDANDVDLREAFWRCIGAVHPERCPSPRAAAALRRCTDAYAALGAGTWGAQEELEVGALAMGCSVPRRSYFEYIPPP